MDDLQLGTGGGGGGGGGGIHLFNRSWFILLVIALPLFLLELFTGWVYWRGADLATLASIAVSCVLADFLLGRLTQSIALQVDQYKAAAEASTSEVCEKLSLLGFAYRNFLNFMCIDRTEIRESVRLKNPNASAREVEKLVQDAIEAKLKDRYAIVLPFWPFRYNNGPTSSFKLAATRFYRAMESLRRLEPTIERRDALEELVLRGQATQQTLKDKDQLDSIISQALIRVNGEIKEIPPMAPQILNWRFGWVVILATIPFGFFLWMCFAIATGIR